MFLYFFIVRLAALFGNKKARMLVSGQKETLSEKGCRLLADRKGCVWIHAASVGEFEQARPLIERIRTEHAGKNIVVTFFSPSGYEARKNYPLVDGVYYLPFATRRNAKRFIDALQPKMAIFVKYEFWPAYLRELKKRNIPAYSISAIFRPSQRFFKWYGGVSRKLLHSFRHIYVQDEASLQLLRKYGVKECSVAGDTRFDRVAQVKEEGERRNDDRLTLIENFVAGSTRVIVAGSTWPEDEKLLEQYIANRECKLILVPHEINEAHLHYIFNLFQGRFVRYTRANTTSLMHAQVMVIDTIGLLSSIYRFGQVAYIGGGFGEGIHNTIEAAVYGMPVIFGPNYHHFREAHGLIAVGAGKSITKYRDLETAFDNALDNYRELGDKAAAYVQSELGATDKIYRDLFNS